MIAEAGFMLLPLGVSAIYGDGQTAAFLLPIGLLLLFGLIMARKKPADATIYAREGFVIVSGAWIAVSLFGALPFIISGAIPNFIDALFETVSGFTTTGASVIADLSVIPKSVMFWRSFTHWVGGMGVLVFVMAIVPLAGGRSVYLMRAESPGPVVGKLVPKVRSTAMILYGIYIGLTVAEVILLCAGGMPLYDSLLNSFGSVGTGGFGIYGDSIAHYGSAYFDWVIAIFMVLCGVNFNLFYLIMIGHAVQVLKSEELRWYMGFIVVSVAVIVADIFAIYGSVTEAFRYAAFQVSSIITTTGFATADFNLWPPLSRTILVVLMIVGACAGSTGGGLKIARVIILLKSILRDIRRALHPRNYSAIRLEGKMVDDSVASGVGSYFALYMIMSIISVLLVSANELDFTTTVTAVAACINNIGPGLEMVGPMGNYAGFNAFSTIILTIDMLMGRLEIIPMLMLASPGIWRARRARQ
jgi:trk system potassium uptake protein TrkH